MRTVSRNKGDSGYVRYAQVGRACAHCVFRSFGGRLGAGSGLYGPCAADHGDRRRPVLLATAQYAGRRCRRAPRASAAGLYGRADPLWRDCHGVLGCCRVPCGDIHRLSTRLSRAEYRMGAALCQLWPSASAAHQRGDLRLWRQCPDRLFFLHRATYVGGTALGRQLCWGQHNRRNMPSRNGTSTSG
jgi:hypothetical protein